MIPPFILNTMLPKNKFGDRVYAWFRYISRHRRIPNRKTGQSYSEHLYQIKTDGSLLDPLRQFVSDKEYVKIYISSVVGSSYTCKTYQLLTSESDIETFLPASVPCVIKPTHSSGQVFICTNEHILPERKLLKHWLKTNYYRKSREQNYRHLVPKIMVEEFFSRDGKTPPPDYKIFCFSGLPKIIQVDSNRFGNHTRNLYDVSWNWLPIRLSVQRGPRPDRRPSELEEMIAVAAKLARPFPFIRVDFFALNGEVRAVELTNCPGGGNSRVTPAYADQALGKLFNGSCVEFPELE